MPTIKNGHQPEKEVEITKKQAVSDKPLEDTFNLEEKQQELAKLKQKIAEANHTPLQALPILIGWAKLAFTIIMILHSQKIEENIRQKKQNLLQGHTEKFDNRKEEIYQKNKKKIEQEITDISKNLPDQLKNHPVVKTDITNLLNELKKLPKELKNVNQHSVAVEQKTFDQAKKEAIASSNHKKNQTHQSTISRKTNQQLVK